MVNINPLKMILTSASAECFGWNHSLSINILLFQPLCHVTFIWCKYSHIRGEIGINRQKTVLKKITSMTIPGQNDPN